MKFDVSDDDLGEVLKLCRLQAGEAARRRVHDADRANPDARAQDEGSACVEADTEFTRDHGIVGKARIGRRVFDDEDIVGEDGIRAESDVSRRVRLSDPALGLEPLPVAVDKRDERDRREEKRGRGPAYGVEMILGWRIEDAQIAKRRETLALVCRKRQHLNPPRSLPRQYGAWAHARDAFVTKSSRKREDRPNELMSFEAHEAKRDVDPTLPCPRSLAEYHAATLRSGGTSFDYAPL